MTLMALGPHIFDVLPLNYQSFERQTEAKWPLVSRFGQRPQRQFTGFGDDRLTLQGVLFPEEFGGRAELDALRLSQANATSLMMVGAISANALRIFGRVVILTIKDSQDYIGKDGLGRRIRYDLTLAPHNNNTQRRGLFG